MSEIWKDVKGYEGLYQVSNKGNVKSFYKNRNLKPSKHSRGYLVVSLFENHNRKQFFIHRLVAETFIDNVNHKEEVNHKDGNKTNNCVENLEWCTGSENRLHAYDTGLRNAPVFSPVLMFSLDGTLLDKFPSICEASRRTGANEGNIYECCNGNRKSVGGYVFRKAVAE